MKRSILGVPVFLALVLAGAAADELFVRGDTNNDGSVDIVDSANILAKLLADGPGPTTCADAWDTIDNGSVQISDAVDIVCSPICGCANPIEPPYPEPGEDPTPDELGCDSNPRLEPIVEENVILWATDVTVPGGDSPGGDAVFRISTDKPLDSLQFTLRVEGLEGARFWVSEYRRVAFDWDYRCKDEATFSTFWFLPVVLMNPPERLIGPGEGIALFHMHVCMPEGTQPGTYQLLVENVRTGVKDDLYAHIPQVLAPQITVESAVTVTDCEDPEDPPNSLDPLRNGIEYLFDVPPVIGQDIVEFTVPIVVKSEYPLLSFDMAVDFNEYALDLVDVTPALRVGETEPTVFDVASDSTYTTLAKNSLEEGYLALHVEMGSAVKSIWEPKRPYEVAQLTFRVRRPYVEFLMGTLRFLPVGPDGAYQNEATFVDETFEFTEAPAGMENRTFVLRGDAIPADPGSYGIRVTYLLTEAVGRPGESGIPINFFLVTNSAIQGFSMAFTYDRSLLAIENVVSHVQISGKPPDFLDVNAWTPYDPEAPHGVTMAVTADIMQKKLFFPSPEEVMATATFSILPDAAGGSEAAITFEDDTVGVQPVSNAVIYRGLSFPPGSQGTTVHVLNRVGGGVKVLGEVSIFLRADGNIDSRVDIADAISILEYLFMGRQASPCPDAADANDDGAINLADPIAILATLFTPDWVIAEPYPTLGEDPTPEDDLGPCYYW